MRDLISVVIPVYNVERYLQRCLNSVVSQTYKNLEIILVDDGSTDLSGKICDEWASKDNRIVVIHKTNGGLSSARNTGLDVAKGRYIAFVDSDDYVEKDYVKTLVKVLEEEKVDVAVCGFWYLYKNHLEQKGYSGTCILMSQIDYLQFFLTDWTCGLIWNKIFKRKVVNGIWFEEGHIIDDEFFTYKAIINCNRVALFEDPLYYYRMRATSVMSSSSEYVERILLDKIKYTKERFENVTKSYPQLKQVYLKDLVNSLIRYKRQSIHYPNAHFEVKKTINEYKLSILLSNLKLKTKYAFLRGAFFEKKRESRIDSNIEREFKFFE